MYKPSHRQSLGHVLSIVANVVHSRGKVYTNLPIRSNT
nr:MAG TPA: hypothetical protein [Caudoviricetes sp.]